MLGGYTFLSLTLIKVREKKENKEWDDFFYLVEKKFGRKKSKSFARELICDGYWELICEIDSKIALMMIIKKCFLIHIYMHP